MLFQLSLTIRCYCYNLLLVLIIIIITLPCRTNSETERYFCDTRFSCGNGLQMYYPFWSAMTTPHCGYPGFRFDCHYQLYGRPVLNISNNLYYIQDFQPAGSSLMIINLDFHEKSCPRPRRNFTVDHAFNPFLVDKKTCTNFTYFFNCTSEPPFVSLPSENQIGFSYSKFHLGCLDYNDTIRSYAFQADFINPKILEWSWKNCEENVVVPVLSDNNKVRFMENNTLDTGFRVTFNTPIGCESCEKDGGLCLYYETKRNFNCTYCELEEEKYRLNQSRGGYECVPVLPNHSSNSPFSGGAIAGVVGLTIVIIFVL